MPVNTMFARSIRDVKPDDYDLQALASLFGKNKRTTLEYGDIRHRMLKDFPKQTNDRLNVLLEYLREQDFINEVSRGKFRVNMTKPEPNAAKRVVQEQAVAPTPTTQPKPTVTVANRPVIKRGDFVAMYSELLKEMGAKGVTSEDAARFFDDPEARASQTLSGLFRRGRCRRAYETRNGRRAYRYFDKAIPMGELRVIRRPPLSKTEHARREDAALAYVAAHPDCSLEDIAQALGMAAQTVRRSVDLDALVKEGRLATRTKSLGQRSWSKVYFIPSATQPTPTPPQATPPSTPPQQATYREQAPLRDRLIAFVKAHPGCVAMDVAREFHMSEMNATSFLNQTAANRLIERKPIASAVGPVWHYYPLGASAGMVQPSAPPPRAQAAQAAPPIVRSTGPEPKPAMQVAMERAGIPAPKVNGMALVPHLLYTLRVEVDPSDSDQMAALAALQDSAIRVDTVNIEVQRG